MSSDVRARIPSKMPLAGGKKPRAANRRSLSGTLKIAAAACSGWRSTCGGPRSTGWIACWWWSVTLTSASGRPSANAVSASGLRAAIEAAQELMDCADLDTLYRRERRAGAREDRAGAVRLVSVGQSRRGDLVGTYGTDDNQAQIHRRTIRPSSVAERNEVLTTPDHLWAMLQKPLPYWATSTTQVLPESGWNVATPMQPPPHHRRIVQRRGNHAHATRRNEQQEVTAVHGSSSGQPA